MVVAPIVSPDPSMQRRASGSFSCLGGEGDVDHARHAGGQTPRLRVSHLPMESDGKKGKGGGVSYMS